MVHRDLNRFDKFQLENLGTTARRFERNLPPNRTELNWTYTLIQSDTIMNKHTLSRIQIQLAKSPI